VNDPLLAQALRHEIRHGNECVGAVYQQALQLQANQDRAAQADRDRADQDRAAHGMGPARTADQTGQDTAATAPDRNRSPPQPQQ